MPICPIRGGGHQEDHPQPVQHLLFILLKDPNNKCYHQQFVSVLLSATVKRFSVSRMRDFVSSKSNKNQVKYCFIYIRTHFHATGR